MKLDIYFYRLVEPKEELYEKHKRVVLFCRNEGVSLPLETSKFFRCKPDDYSHIDFNASSRVPILLNRVDFEENQDLILGRELTFSASNIHKYTPGDIYIQLTDIKESDGS